MTLIDYMGHLGGVQWYWCRECEPNTKGEGQPVLLGVWDIPGADLVASLILSGFFSGKPFHTSRHRGVSGMGF